MTVAFGIALVVVAIAALVFGGQPSKGALASGEAAIETSPSTSSLAPTGSAEPPPSRPKRVAFFGDSIAVETNPSLTGLLAERGIAYRFDGFGGTAMCDYLDEMRAIESVFHPDAVVLLFTGNALTPCMIERTGGGVGLLDDGSPFDMGAYVDAYEHDTIQAIGTFDASTAVYLFGPLENRWGRKPAAVRLDEVYERIADEHPNVHHVTQLEQLTPGGSYADELPCAAGEPCTVGELVPVRGEDGGHLCPGSGFCFGGLRVAAAIAGAIGAAE